MRSKGRKKIGNRGFTLIEMLMVLAITAIILALVLISYNVVNNANATKAARRLESVIRTARTTTMSKGMDAGKLTLTMENGNLYAQIGDPTTAKREQICNSGVQVEGILCTTDYATPRAGAAFTTATLTFNTSGTVRHVADSTTYNKFILRRGNRRFEVIVYSETGSLETNMF